MIFRLLLKIVEKQFHRNSLTVYLKNSIAWMMLGFLIQVVRDLAFLLRKKLYIYMVERLLHPVSVKPSKSQK